SGFETGDCGQLGAVGDGGSQGSLPSGGGADGGGTPGKTLFYVHTNTTLYSVDPSNIAAPPTQIGDFDCIGGGGGNDSSMTDLGVAKDGSLYAVSQSAAYPLTVSGSTVHCAAKWPLPGKNNNFYGLTVAPENTVATGETLIAADDSGALWKIDSTTGATTQVGTLGTDPSSGKAWGLSGDIVFLANGGSPVGFATVRVKSTDPDTLIEVDVSKVVPGTASAMKAVIGKVAQGSGCAAPTTGSAPSVGTGFKSMYGIAAYEDKVYGFSHLGDIVQIDNNTGSACLLSSDSSRSFSGAGVTTSAPVVAPTPR
ncbi:MAG: hypothetical protein ACRELY_05230, partial [Polyangiaceae bacterium]